MVSSAALLDALEEYYDEMWESGVEWSSLMWEGEEITLNVEGVVGVLQGVQTEGGGEGGAEDVRIVVSFTHEDGTVELFKKYASYASHCGYDWDGYFRKTTPVQKTITVYEDVEG